VFTGIVERSVQVASIDSSRDVRRICVDVPWSDTKHGESVAVNGACLTIAGIRQIDRSTHRLSFDVVQETLDKTNLGRLEVGSLVHVERAMRAGDRFDGHFVQGHVDGVAPITRQVADPTDWRICGRAPEHLVKYLVPKGSVSLDGVSLTLANVAGADFEIALIPTTLEITQLGRREVGWPMNIECDMLVKSVVGVLELRGL
jgi:riboflavin synthase